MSNKPTYTEVLEMIDNKLDGVDKKVTDIDTKIDEISTRVTVLETEAKVHKNWVMWVWGAVVVAISAAINLWK